MDIAPDGHLICNLCGEPGGECVCGKPKSKSQAKRLAVQRGSRFSAEERAALEGGLNALESNLRDREEDLREEIEGHIQDPETQRFMQENIDNIRAEIATLRKMLVEGE